MQSNTITLKILNPRGKRPEIALQSSTTRLDDLNGKKIGILHNTKSGGTELLPFVEKALKKQLPGVELRTWDVPFMVSPDVKASRIKEIAEYADGVIALMAD